VNALASIADPLLTVWPVITEAMYLLRETPRGQDALFDILDDGAIRAAELDDGDLRRMKMLMRKYLSLPMDFADAALVRVAERDRLNRIVTFDRHFKVYALPGRSRFVVLGGG